MGLETGTFVEDLVVTNPPGGDSKSQGDDHIRLIKNVLRNTFKRATKAASFPGATSKSANYTVLSTDDNLTILCDTTSPFTLTLPTLTVNDAGWGIFIVKTTLDANPVFIAPPSGTINGFTKIRRSIEFVSTRILWTGGAFVATRPTGDPIGSSTDYHGTTLPNGYLWADGNTFTAANFVELNAKLGGNITPDLRGRSTFGRDDMGIGAAGRLTASAISGITGTSLGSAGGAETNTLSGAQIPAHTHTATTGSQSTSTTGAGTAHQHAAFIGDDGHSHATSTGGTLAVNLVSPSGTALTGGASTTNSATTGVKVRSTAGNAATADNQVAAESAHTHSFAHTHGITTDAMVGVGNAHNNMPPAIVVNKIIVAE